MYMVYGRKYKTLTAVANRFNKNYMTLYMRVNVYGWSLLKAVQTPNMH